VAVWRRTALQLAAKCRSGGRVAEGVSESEHPSNGNRVMPPSPGCQRTRSEADGGRDHATRIDGPRSNRVARLARRGRADGAPARSAAQALHAPYTDTSTRRSASRSCATPAPYGP